MACMSMNFAVQQKCGVGVWESLSRERERVRVGGGREVVRVRLSLGVYARSLAVDTHV